MIATTEDSSRQAAAAYALSGMTSVALLQVIADSLVMHEFPGAIFPVSANGRVLCAAAPDWRHWRRLAPLLAARIGLTLSNFPSPVQDATPSRYLASLLGGFTPRLWCRIDLAIDSKLQSVALEACAQLVREVAAHSALISPPISAAGLVELLEAFEGGLQRGDLDQAGGALGTLQRDNHLDSINARFLRLRWLDAHGATCRAEALRVAGELHGLRLPEEVRRLVERIVAHS